LASLKCHLPPSANQIKFSRREPDAAAITSQERKKKQYRLCLSPHVAPSPSFPLGFNPLSWLFLSFGAIPLFHYEDPLYDLLLISLKWPNP